MILISALPAESQLLGDQDSCFADAQQGLAPLAQLEEPSLQPLLPQGVQDW